ncbi:hypothetical protein [Cellulomonas phragmiteti]|uniref:Hemagglutinin protein n=1 Tax=Cellulomonas phragmiteti TaxID=478780 RepID=A0ABQ4DIV2_9CELL|nr:hypothetical protein [Cellulomonas phragmiteti]GIG39279.1 hypothetical protein Cph01nite_10410 [Cellulomonas phragmiteti]
MAPTFTRVVPGYYALTVALPDGAAGAQVAFAPTAPDGAPDSLTLAQTWQDHPGTYLFLARAPASPTGFLAELRTFLSTTPGTAALWLPDPDVPATAWSGSRLAWSGTAPGPRATTGLSQVALRSLALWVPGGAAVDLAPTQDALVVTPGVARATLTAGYGATTLPVDGPVTLPFTDLVAGTLTLGTTLENTGATHAPDVDRLDLGIRYSTPGAPAVVGGVPTWTTASYRYPLLVPPPATLPLAVTLDPLHPTLASRTLFALAAGTALTSSLVTTTGRAVTLVAGADPAAPCGFVPAVRALTVPARDTDPYTLVPSGAFTVADTAAGAGSPPQLMCGGSGVEYLTTTAVPGSTVHFVPGQPAHAASGLTADVTTSWVYVVGPEASSAVYHAQADAATLYHPPASDGRAPDARTGATDPTILGYLELAGTALPAGFDPAATPPTLFPMVGLTGLTGDDGTAAQTLEQLAICPARRLAISAVAAAQPVGPGSPHGQRQGVALAGAVTAATTPQGLYATFDDAGMSLLLGQSQAGSRRLVLGDLQPPLVEAFQSSQLFLVATDREALGRLATLTEDAGRLTIALNDSDTWTFDVLADGWAARGTALILKFAGRSLLDLLQDTGAWALAETLNGGDAAALAAQQQRLLDLVRDALTRADPAGGGDPDLAPFAALATDPAWNGVLVLGCRIPLDGLPEQMSGIAAGIDPARFVAHHLGMTVTPVQAVGEALTPQDSSLFGLVAYDDPADLVGTGADYRFKVNTLTVRFAASTVVSFASRIELLVNALFGDPVTLVGGAHGNNVVLDGVYLQQGSTSSYVFSTAADSPFTAPTSAVLAGVDITRAQFVTVLPADRAEAQHVPALSRFLFWGTCRFRPGPFDLFSFGDAADGSAAGALTFADVAVDLSYDPSDPAASSVYTFDAGRLTYDLAATSPRPGSLFEAFPLTLTGFVHALPPAAGSQDAATTPSGLGFLPVDVPLSQGAMTAPWFGMVADLALGTPGALAAQAGFTASLLVAWSPGVGTDVAVGLKLPGTGGPHRMLSLQSVLRLKIAALALRKVGAAYVLALHDISLSLLSLSFPPSGQTEILLFGDPGGQSQPSLGWYGGYAQDPPKPPAPTLQQVPGAAP